jgi:CubicO group peptidase (beta-lactamase class C family)
MAGELSRRALIKRLFSAAAGIAVFPMTGCLSSRSGAEAPLERERAAMGDVARAFSQRFSVPTLSVAISRNSQMVYEEQFQLGNRLGAELPFPSSLFRIASVTKPITSVAIFSLIEKGELKLDDRVFGSSGILGTKYGDYPYREHVSDITVDHLLTHSCGGWQNDSTDPIFRFATWDHAELISWTLENLPLFYPPGQHWAYSNFGYCLLGRVIEQITGEPYADYVQKNILAACGISDMRISGNTLEQCAPNEVVYAGQDGEDPYSMNVSRMDSHGGWLATPSDLVRFLNHVDGASSPSLLKPETIRMMTTPSPAYPAASSAKYARGWFVRNEGAGNWWHNGSLPGSTTIMVRTSTGLCWAALTNTRTQPPDQINGALDEMVWDMVRRVPSWRA